MTARSLSATLMGVNGRLCALALMSWPLLSSCGREGGSQTSLGGTGGSLETGGEHAGVSARGGLGGEGALSGVGGSLGGTGGVVAGAGSGTGGLVGSTGAVGGSAGARSEGGAPGAAGQAGSGGPAGAGAGTESAGGEAGSSAECGLCTAYAAPTEAGSVGVVELDALSGLALSRAQPGIFFAHNDHDRSVVYAIDLQGREHARFSLDGAAANDIEDIAVGRCAAATCIYLGDIGDNDAGRGEYAILRFPEPTVPAAPGSTATTPAFERFRFTYEDGSHNAEGLMVGPDGSVYVVTKLAAGSGGPVAATGPSSIYRLPAALTTGAVATATKVATLSVPADGDLAASAAAAHPCGLGFLLRTYDKVYEFTVPSGMDFEAAFTSTPKVVAAPDESQSEGIDYRADGFGFITSGEGEGAAIMQTLCVP